MYSAAYAMNHIDFERSNKQAAGHFWGVVSWEKYTQLGGARMSTSLQKCLANLAALWDNDTGLSTWIKPKQWVICTVCIRNKKCELRR